MSIFDKLFAKQKYPLSIAGSLPDSEDKRRKETIDNYLFFWDHCSHLTAESKEEVVSRLNQASLKNIQAWLSELMIVEQELNIERAHKYLLASQKDPVTMYADSADVLSSIAIKVYRELANEAGVYNESAMNISLVLAGKPWREIAERATRLHRAMMEERLQGTPIAKSEHIISLETLTTAPSKKRTIAKSESDVPSVNCPDCGTSMPYTRASCPNCKRSMIFNVGNATTQRIAKTRERSIRKGGLEEPYCSNECYETAGKEIFSAQAMNTSGPCAYCQTVVTVSLSGGGTIFPWKGKWVFTCRKCHPEVDNFIKNLNECCQCGKNLLC